MLGVAVDKAEMLTTGGKGVFGVFPKDVFKSQGVVNGRRAHDG